MRRGIVGLLHSDLAQPRTKFLIVAGLLAKTDRLDARMLALFANNLARSAKPPLSKTVEDLKEPVQARDSAVAEQTALQNQLARAATRFLRQQLKRRLGRLATDIAALAREILRQIKADQGPCPPIRHPPVDPGFRTHRRRTLLAQLGELGECNDEQIAMLAGLAPIADNSGERVIRSGRPPARRVLYFSALSATRCHAAMKALYQRLLAAGKPPKLAIVARKLLVLANSLLSNDRAWQPLPPNRA